MLFSIQKKQRMTLEDRPTEENSNNNDPLISSSCETRRQFCADHEIAVDVCSSDHRLHQTDINNPAMESHNDDVEMEAGFLCNTQEMSSEVTTANRDIPSERSSSAAAAAAEEFVRRCVHLLDGNFQILHGGNFVVYMGPV